VFSVVLYLLLAVYNFGLLREGFPAISPAKMNGFKPNLTVNNYVIKETIKKI